MKSDLQYCVSRLWHSFPVWWKWEQKFLFCESSGHQHHPLTWPQWVRRQLHSPLHAGTTNTTKQIFNARYCCLMALMMMPYISSQSPANDGPFPRRVGINDGPFPRRVGIEKLLCLWKWSFSSLEYFSECSKRMHESIWKKKRTTTQTLQRARIGKKESYSW